MKRVHLLVLVLFGLLLMPIESIALVSSNGSGGGAWSAPPSWDTGVPICGDSIFIVSGDVVTIAVQQDYSACGSPMVLIIDGTLIFPSNGPKLKLPAGSTVIVNPGGLITAPGGGNGNKIFIGVDWVWEKNDGDVLGYTCFGACGPLPIQLLSLDIIAHEQSVCVKWQTLSESNNEYFTVERSEDGLNFHQIVEVAGAGNSNIILDYEAKDYDPIQGTAYYRLKQTDYDGTFSYSEIMTIKFESSGLPEMLRFPNPMNRSDDLVIAFHHLNANDVVHVEISGMRAELRQSYKLIALVDGPQIISLKTIGLLETGLYFVTFQIRGDVLTKKLLVH